MFFTFLELVPDLLVQKPSETDGFESIIVVDGTPSVETERQDKLKALIYKIFGKFGQIVNIHYPKNENGVTKG